MKSIVTQFVVHRAGSGLFSDYRSGDVAYIGNGLSNNAVLGFVKPRQGDKVFTFRGVTVSAFAEATVQPPPFIACSRAGNGMLVLEPRTPMPVAQLAHVAAYINLAIRWRFSWYRQVTADRLRAFPVPNSVPSGARFDVRAAMPRANAPVVRDKWGLRLHPVRLGDLFELRPGDYHSWNDMPAGDVPIISCGDRDNGVTVYRGPVTGLYRNRLTIAFNGMNALSAKFHPYEFAAKDDVAVCIPKRPLRTTTQLFVQMMVNRERWRYSYYRKCFREKLERFEVSLPFKGGEIDEDLMEAVVTASPYWPYVKDRFDSGSEGRVLSAG